MRVSWQKNDACISVLTQTQFPELQLLSFKNYKQMDAYLLNVDKGMRDDEVPITARQLQALSRISIENEEMEFNISSALELRTDQIHGFEGDVLVLMG